jgi:hypothetical protein
MTTNLDISINPKVHANPENYPFLFDLNLDKDVIRRLSNHLDGIVSGDDEILVTPIAKERNPLDILRAWDKIYNSKQSKINSVLSELEQSNRSKFGPRSISKPWVERMDSCFEYFMNRKRNISLHKWSYIASNNGTLRPLSTDNASKFLKNSTNSGLPYYARKGKVKRRTVERFDDLLNRNDPCILFTRTQENNKTRNVWGYPMAETLEEMKYYRPLLDYQSRLPWRSALLGPRFVDESITKMILNLDSSNESLVSVDFSSYDASVCDELEKYAFDYIASLFQPRFRDEIKSIFKTFNTIGLITPTGVIKGNHGVPSGSTFTNEVDSIVQYIISMNTGFVSSDKIQIQGDDGAYCIKTSDLNNFARAFTDAGLHFNYDKSYESQDYVVYLQNLYHKDYINNNLIGGIYPTYRALNRIIYQERWADFEDFDLPGIDYYSIRTLSILENCKHHPLFEDFVKFIFSLDKYNLRFSHKNLVRYDTMTQQGSGSGGVINNQYGDNVRGIKSFRSYNLIKDLVTKH